MNVDDHRIPPDNALRLADRATAVDHLGGRETAVAETAELTQRLGELQDLLVAQGRHRVLVVLQGRDTAGKDGAIRNVFGPLDPQGVTVAAFGVPTEPERAHDYLWRVHPHVPGNGELVIFNRSHYEDVLVVRVHDLAPEDRWSKRFDHIRHFEQLLIDEGTTIIKLFLHISADEQKERLQARLDDATKRWKFNPGDLADRARWADYDAAFEDAISRTSTDGAPWFVIPADRKWIRDLLIARIMVNTLEALEMSYPPDAEGVDDIHIT